MCLTNRRHMITRTLPRTTSEVLFICPLSYIAEKIWCLLDHDELAYGGIDILVHQQSNSRTLCCAEGVDTQLFRSMFLKGGVKAQPIR